MENIIYICNNYGSVKDGIGAYSKKFHMEFNNSKKYHLECFTENTDSYPKYKLFFSKKMSKAIDNAIKWGKKTGEKHMVIVEYPFVEYNPFVLKKLKKLKKVNGEKKFILSLHEYSRVKPLRRMFINAIINISDIILLTSEFEREKVLRKFNKKKIFIRTIPSNIDEEVNEVKNNNIFSFFGLINSSKAFEPMIEGWKRFQDRVGDNNYLLNIISSTDIECIENEKYHIVHYKSISDKQIASVLSTSRFCILPIKPMISENNATLKAACLYKDVCVGIFDKTLDGKIGDLKMKEYTPDDFQDIYHKCIEMNVDELNKKSEISYTFGQKYSFKATVSSYEKILENEIIHNENN